VFEALVAYLAQITDKTKVTRLAGIAWSTVGSIVERVVERRLDPGRLDGLSSIEKEGTGTSFSGRQVATRRS